MDPNVQPALAEALGRMWNQFLPQIRERITILETAAAAYDANRFSIEQREAAAAAAHKLAGVLGTFGLTRGTVLARELEIMYSLLNGPEPAHGARLTSVAAELRSLVENREQSISHPNN